MNDNDFLKLALSKLEIKAGLDLSSLFESGDVIEVFNHDRIQVFRNMEYFRPWSHTLEDFSTKLDAQLFDRPSIQRQQLETAMRKVLLSKTPALYLPNIQPHICQEINEVGKTAIVNYKFMAPLFDENKEVKAVLSSYNSAVGNGQSPQPPNGPKYRGWLVEFLKAILYGVAGNLATDLVKHLIGSLTPEEYRALCLDGHNVPMFEPLAA